MEEEHTKQQPTMSNNNNNPKAKKVKKYILDKRYTGFANRSDRTLDPMTLDELKKYFGYTLECGQSWNPKIKSASEIKSIKSFITNLNKSFDEKREMYYCELIDTIMELPIVEG